jgi:hypothetical protein
VSTSETGSFHAAGGAGVGTESDRVAVVDVDSAGPDALSDVPAEFGVAGPDACREAEFTSVGEVDRLLGRCEGRELNNGAEC